MTIDEVRAWARMMREEGIASLSAAEFSMTMGSLPAATQLPADMVNLEDLNHIPADPLLDPVTFSGGVPSFRPVPADE